MPQHGGQEPLIAEDRPSGGDESQSETQLAPGAVLVESVVESEEHLTELRKETLLPVTGMVRLSRRELEVIDHPAFQRLFEIY
jgi:hypothetical protein